MKTIRLIVTTSDGKKSEVFVPVENAMASSHGWKSVSIPLQAITGFDRTNKVISEVSFSADATTTFYIGDMRVVNDTTPIRGDVNIHTLNLALGDSFTFVASGTGGSSPLKYTWDFDDKDGIQVEAEGRAITRRFRKPGTFTITMTVADKYGLKTPYSTTLKVTVNP